MGALKPIGRFARLFLLIFGLVLDGQYAHDLGRQGKTKKMRIEVLNESWGKILDENGFLWMMKVSNSKDVEASAWYSSL